MKNLFLLLIYSFIFIGNSSSQITTDNIINNHTEVRYLFGGCNGTWTIICYNCSSNNPIILGSGTYDFCKKANKEYIITEIESQEREKKERVVQPFSDGKDNLTREDIENLRIEKTTITLLGNPIKDNTIKGKIKKSVILEKEIDFQYKIIGFDGKEYQNGQTEVTDSLFNITLENKLIPGTYFIIMGSGDNHNVYSTNFVVTE